MKLNKKYLKGKEKCLILGFNEEGLFLNLKIINRI